MQWLAVVCSLLCVAVCQGDQYYIGTGRYDITGPAAEVEMMGYAMPQQTAHGIHFRQYSRAFVIADAAKKTRVVFVNADICMGTQIIKMQVVAKLKTLYGDLYSYDNVLISGIHTHSGPAGYFQYVLYEVMSLGFVKETLEVTVNGIVESIKMAHNNMKLGAFYINSGELISPQSNINRSPSAYLLNPAEERNKTKYDVDKTMVVLKMVDEKGSGIGMLDWFAVHCTSMNNTNRLISGDNKGHASFLMEQAMNGKSYFPGQGPFVAAFAQSNEGDVSPNTKGPHCQDTGKPCDFNHSTCNGKNELCVSPGPGKDMFDSTRMIAENQFNFGKKLYDTAHEALSGPVDFRHSFVDMTNVTVTTPNGTKAHTCKPAMGFAFAAGTTDGPGAFDFTQGDTHGNAFWDLVRDVLKDPSPEQVACHHPKPILLDTGEMDFPYPWSPHIVPVQLLRIGQLVIIAVPAEFTTMSGRRVRATVEQVLLKNGFPRNVTTVVAGLSNTYSDYVATYEEYQQQRYEGASTIYGPHTLQAYNQHFATLAEALAKGTSVNPGPSPPDYSSEQIQLLPPVLFDHAPSGKKFGDVATDVNPSYKPNQTVVVKFWAGNPRNDVMTGKTFLTVEKKNSKGTWDVVLTDAFWDTKFSWYHTSELEGESQATVEWTIASDMAAGSYRIRHFGNSKDLNGTITAYSGTSSEFQVTA